MPAPLSLDARRRIAEMQSAFDKAVREGRSPRLEDHIPSDWPPEERRELQKALLEVEFHYLQLAGAPACLDAYIERFPGQSDVVVAAFQGQSTVVAPGPALPATVREGGAGSPAAGRPAVLGYEGAGLAAEALSKGGVASGVRQQYLDGDEPIERRLSCLVDRPHAALPDQPKDLQLREQLRERFDRGCARLSDVGAGCLRRGRRGVVGTADDAFEQALRAQPFRSVG
jgi:hypothetical protein